MMFLSCMGNNKPIKEQVAIQKPLKESSEAMASCCNNSLHGLYIKKNNVNEVKGTAPVAESDVQNAKQLVVVDSTKNAVSILRNYSIM